MKRTHFFGIYVTALLLLGLTRPILGWYNRAVLSFGIPVTWWAIFGLWSVAIVVLALWSKRKDFES